MNRTKLLALCVTPTLALALTFALACSGGHREGGEPEGTGAGAGEGAGTTAPVGGRLSLKGSDTMVILAQRFAEGYMASHAGSVVEVSGGGSGTGFAALLNGTTDVANASRPINEREVASLLETRHVAPHEVAVALDALAIYVHNDNAIASLTMEQLSQIFRGQITNWSGVGGPDAPIVLYSRENNSGTYAYFKEHVLDGADFAVTAQTLPGTAAVINAVAHDGNGIGYGGIGYAAGVRTVPVVPTGGTAPVAPTMENAVAGTYPIARFLYMYTGGEPTGASADFLAWVITPAGQAVVTDSGFFPLPPGGAPPSAAIRRGADPAGIAPAPTAPPAPTAEPAPRGAIPGANAPGAIAPGAPIEPLAGGTAPP